MWAEPPVWLIVLGMIAVIEFGVRLGRRIDARIAQSQPVVKRPPIPAVDPTTDSHVAFPELLQAKDPWVERLEELDEKIFLVTGVTAADKIMLSPGVDPTTDEHVAFPEAWDLPPLEVNTYVPRLDVPPVVHDKARRVTYVDLERDHVNIMEWGKAEPVMRHYLPGEKPEPLQIKEFRMPLLGGPKDGQRAIFAGKLPERIVLSGSAYQRVLDPDTEVALGYAYVGETREE